MADTLTIDFSKAVPLFPLPDCMLLPHATLPLHIFEPRYRVMVRDALDAAGLIAMAIFEGGHWKVDYQGQPPLRPYVCIGYILRHEPLADGRYNILLQGVCRARIRKELPHQPYRVALLAPADTRPTMEIDLHDQRQRLEGLIEDPTLGQLASIVNIRKWMRSDIPTTALIDLSILSLASTAGDRYDMLAQPDPEKRAHWLEQCLHDTRHTVRLANRLGPSQTDDGLNLN